MKASIRTRSTTVVRTAAWILAWGCTWIVPQPAVGQTGSQTIVIEETSTPVSYGGTWAHENTQRSWSGGTAGLSTTAAATVTLNFTGTSVKWIGFRGPQAGIARVFLDGALAATVDTFATSEQMRAAVFSSGELGDTSHTLTIEVSGDKHALSSGTVVVVDAFEITPGVATPVDTTPPTVTITSPQAGAAIPSGIIIRSVALDNVAVAGVRFVVDGVAIGDELPTAPYAMAWDTSTIAEGAHTLSAIARDAAGNTRSATISVRVDRTAPTVTLMPHLTTAPLAGIATVSVSASDDVGVDSVWFSVDGVLVGEDTTPPYEMPWNTLTVADGSHTLQASVRDRAGGLNTAATTMSVSNGIPVEESSATITYTGTWSQGNEGLRAWIGGTAAIATLTEFPARATLSFDGTGVKWIGFRGPQAGIANVYLDGEQVATVDLFDPAEHIRAVVFSIGGLAAAPHTLTIEATGKRNPLSVDPFVVVDAFIISD
jgi:hypothetical protein